MTNLTETMQTFKLVFLSSEVAMPSGFQEELEHWYAKNKNLIALEEGESFDSWGIFHFSTEKSYQVNAYTGENVDLATEEDKNTVFITVYDQGVVMADFSYPLHQ